MVPLISGVPPLLPVVKENVSRLLGSSDWETILVSLEAIHEPCTLGRRHTQSIFRS